jgi:hypothetical protein
MAVDAAAAAPGPADSGTGRNAEGEEGRLRAGPAPEPGRGQQAALFRYELIVPLLDEGLSRAERGELTAAICAAEHPGPDGQPVTVSPPTVRRWIAAYRAGGFAALVPQPKDQPARCPGPVRASALALKDANPNRTARMIRAILLGTYRDQPGDVPSERTLQRWFAGLPPVALEPGTSQAAGAFGRYEADAPMDRWPGDIMHGPALAGRPVYLHAFLDRSRFLTGARFVRRPDAVRFAGVLHGAIAAHGAPATLYTVLSA